MPNLTTDQITRLHEAHTDLFRAHDRIWMVTNEIQNTGQMAGRVLDIQLSVTDVMGKLSDLLAAQYR